MKDKFLEVNYFSSEFLYSGELKKTKDVRREW